MSEQDILLIQQYLSGELQNIVLANFEQRLQTDPEFRKTVFSQQFVEWSLRPHPLLKAKQIIEALGDDLWTADEKKSLSDTPPVTYTLDELLALFEPIKEMVEQAVTRSSSPDSTNKMQALVMLPEDGIDCRNRQLTFDFEELTPFPIAVTVFDNREHALLSDTIQEGVYEHTVLLDDFKPGWYYWQLRADISDRAARRKAGVAKGYFFIDKHLLKKGF